MKCEEIMIRDSPWCVPTDTVAAVAKIMKIEDIDAVAVCESRRNQRLVGIVTARSLVLHALAAECDAGETTIQEVMTRDPVACHRDEDLSIAMHIMYRDQVRRIPVVDDRGELIGAITLADVMLWTSEPKTVIDVIWRMAQRRRARQSHIETLPGESVPAKVRHGGSPFS